MTDIDINIFILLCLTFLEMCMMNSFSFSLLPWTMNFELDFQLLYLVL